MVTRLRPWLRDLVSNPAFPDLLLDSASLRVEELVCKDRVANTAALTTGIANELANPLGYLTSALGALRGRLRRGEPLGADALSLVGDLLEATRRASALVEDLRGLTGAADLDLPAVVHGASRVATAMAARDGVRLTVGAVPAGPGGAAPLGQLVLWLAVAGLRTARSEARLDVTRGEGALALALRHDGPAARGAGALDRAVCASLAASLGGAWREAEDTLRVTLPLGGAPAARAEPPLPAPRGRVLVIDDDEAVAEVLAVRLEQAWSVDICTDPVRALALLRAAGPWDAVVCDVRMEPVSGPELYVQLCAEAPTWRDRFVFVSAGAPSAYEVGILRDGGCPLLTKPNTLHRLLDTVAGRITGSEAQKPPR